jgi:hypothetical protein
LRISSAASQRIPNTELAAGHEPARTRRRCCARAAAVSRLTGVPAGEHGHSAELDELDRLHREQAIEARLRTLQGG